MSVVGLATHGQPVSVEVLPWLSPSPAGIEGEAEVTEATSAVATELAAPPAFPLTFPPMAWIEPQLPLVSPYLYCVPVE